MVNFKKILSKYDWVDNEDVNNINTISEIMGISDDKLTIFTYEDLGLFCKFLPSYMESNHTREELVYINNDRYISGDRFNKPRTVVNIFECEKPYILLKKVVHLKYPGEHFILNLYKPENK